jgi:hypothetical protein
MEIAKGCGRFLPARISALSAAPRRRRVGARDRFGKGRYLLGRAAAEPERGFVGIEIAGEYFALAARRLARRKIANLLLLVSDASYFATTLLPRQAFAACTSTSRTPGEASGTGSGAFRGRLDRPAGRARRAGGRLWFATDFLDYGERWRRSSSATRAPPLCAMPTLARWRAHQLRAKYIAEGRPILRLEVAFSPSPRRIPKVVRASCRCPAGLARRSGRGKRTDPKRVAARRLRTVSASPATRRLVIAGGTGSSAARWRRGWRRTATRSSSFRAATARRREARRERGASSRGGGTAARPRLARRSVGRACARQLAGESIARLALERGAQERIVESRRLAAAAMLEALEKAAAPPGVLLQASAIGF